MEDIRLSVATDVGCIELMHARLDRRPVPPHIHDEYSISVTLRGGLAFDFKGSKHLAASGIISCVAPGEVHNAYAARDGRWEFLNLLVPTLVVKETLGSLDWSESLPDLPHRVVADPGLVRRLVALHRLLTATGDLLERQSARTLVLAEFFRKHSTARGTSPPITIEKGAVDKARELMHGCFAQSISLAALASHAGLSPYYFLRTFHAAIGMTPHMYLNQLRVLEAKRLLSSGANAAQTAVACGFCDQSHMTRQFKRLLFTTPGQYRTEFLNTTKPLPGGRLMTGPTALKTQPWSSPSCR